MARDEMDEITDDRWDEDIWGSLAAAALASSSSSSSVSPTNTCISESHPPKLFFYFGRADHWVADHTRDELMASRAASQSTSHKARTSQLPKTIDDNDRDESESESERTTPLNKHASESHQDELNDGGKWRPRMEIDESGIPHGFCIREFSSPPVHFSVYAKFGVGSLVFGADVFFPVRT